MKFVNPIGRTPGSGVQPRACMCTDGYAGYRGNDDGCVHCGCGCVFFVKHFSLKKASEFPVFSEGFSLL